MSSAPAYKLTYSTMFNPPDELHRQFEQALSRVRGGFGRTHPMWIDGAARTAVSTFELRSPIDSMRFLPTSTASAAEIS